jgi:heat shock protein HslJ
MLLAISACGQEETSGDGQDIQGITWVLDAASIRRLAPGAPADARVDLLIEGDKVSGRAACNSYSGDVNVQAERISVGSLAVTEMACEPSLMELEAAYLSQLLASETYSVSAGSLLLSGRSGTELVFFEEAAPEPLPLTGTDWRLDTIAQGDAVSSTIAGTEVTVVFSENGQLTGNAGCNDYSAGYELADDSLSIGPVGTTQKACADPQGVMDQESTYLQRLDATASYAIQGDQLALFDASGMLLLGYRGT